MSRFSAPVVGLLVLPAVLLGCVDPAASDMSDAPTAEAVSPMDLSPADAQSAGDHSGAFAHQDAQRVDAWWTEIDGERGTATVAIRASTASDNRYEAEIRALFGPLERSWTVAAPPAAAGEIVELTVPLARAWGLDALQADYTTELLVQVRAYGPNGALRDTRPLPVRHLLVEGGEVVALTTAERAALAPRGVRGLAVEAPVAGAERTVETRVLPPVLAPTAR